MVKLQIDIPEGFLEEEVRCGYTVSADMKKVWAVELDLLHLLDTVCKKYGLHYYADSGTLIGAVRHHGFIPWDDDIDVVMFRDDYEMLKKAAAKEFRHPYFFQTLYNDNKLIREHAQIRNSETTGYMPNEKDRPYNKGIFLDIFPLDVVPDEGLRYKMHLAKIRLLWRTIEYGGYVKDYPHELKGKLFLQATNALYKVTDYKKVFRAYEKLCAKYNDSKYSRVSFVAYSRGKEKHMFQKEWWDETVMLPFEFTTIPAPANYDARLTKEYGDYMTIRQVPSTHGGTILDADHPYTDQPDPDQLNTDQPDPDQLNTDQPDPDQLNTDQADPDQLNTDQPDPDQLNTDQPDPDQLNIDQPDPDQLNTDQADPDQLNTDQPDPDQPGIEHSDNDLKKEDTPPDQNE